MTIGTTISFGQNISRIPETPQTTSSERIETTPVPESDVVLPIASINKQVVQSNFRYTFVSNKQVFEHQEERWESRYKMRFPLIVNIEITAVNQSISVTLPNNHTPEDLREIVKRFNYSDFQIIQ